MSATDPITPCRRCGSTDTVTIRCQRGPHYGRQNCAGCGRIRGWAPAPMTPRRAAAFVLYFGRFRGECLAAVAATAEGRRYLAALINEQGPERGLHRAIQTILTPTATAPRRRTNLTATHDAFQRDHAERDRE